MWRLVLSAPATLITITELSTSKWSRKQPRAEHNHEEQAGKNVKWDFSTWKEITGSNKPLRFSFSNSLCYEPRGFLPPIVSKTFHQEPTIASINRILESDPEKGNVSMERRIFNFSALNYKTLCTKCVRKTHLKVGNTSYAKLADRL